MTKVAIQAEQLQLDQTLELAKSLGEEIRYTLKRSHEPQHMGKEITSLASVAFKKQLQKVNLDKVRGEVADAFQEKYQGNQPLGSAFGCATCTTLTYSGLVILIGGTIIVSGGMSIPAVLAASGYSTAGLATVISAMTGVSTGAISAMLTASGATIGLLVIGLCEAMGAC